jgi:membrane protein implicated in regulation of membrane protease activity
MLWWTWLLLGLGLLLLEVVTPGGFFFLFFGVSALVVGTLAGAGMTSEVAQLVVFGVVTTGSLLLFRSPLQQRFQRKPEPQVDSIPGEVATLTEDLPPHGTGKAELRGTTWNVENATASPMSKGQRSRVERVEGLTLFVRPE